MSDNKFDGESHVTPPSGLDTAEAKSKVLVVTHPLLLPPEDQDEDLKEEEKISYGEIIREVIKILPPEICPRKQEDSSPTDPKSGIEALTPRAGIKDDLALPQSPFVLQTVDLTPPVSQNIH